ncbi:hypothetical protein BD309DRAFT_43658 [Dichomitus squalens]|uniref:Uncharacterized protein n=2 Tax=Dichomitus squalens TaxID=114155 RepID=A0A4Q9NRU5_9APHY|nr:hypothetical protein BD309DRAFT_43658 [Dichomitus squalens]TBU65201.1 hypothetical protein BD310DRAFT_305918 [Dichomitus squalens]
MVSTFPSPILSVAADVVKDIEGEDALCSLWALFTKCKESLKDGRRLENISWRLWYRELASAQCTPSSSPGTLSPPFSEKRSPSPVTPISEDGHISQQVPLPHPSLTPTPDITAAHSWHAENSANTVITAGRRLSTASAPMERRKSHSSVGVGKMILDILPANKLDVTSEKERAARSPTTATVAALAPHIAQPRPVVAAVPTVQLPATPPQPDRASFPRVVVVNPTPHPTPPATPSLPHPPTVSAQPSLHLLPPPPARSLISATAPRHLSGDLKHPLLSKAADPTCASPPHKQQPQGWQQLSQQPLVPSSTTSSLTGKPPAAAARDVTATSHDAIPNDVPEPKPKKYNDDTLKASDRRFFLQDAGSPSPERPPSSTSDLHAPPSPVTEHGPERSADDDVSQQDAAEPSPSSATSSHLKSELTGHTSAAGAAAKRARVQVRKAKERHAPARPTLQRLHSHGLRTTSQKKAQAQVPEKQPPHTADAKKTTFNIGSVSSNGPRSGGGGGAGDEGKSSKAVEPEKAREKSGKTRLSSPTPNVPPKKSASTPHIPTAATKLQPLANGAGPSQPRRGIVISTSSEYETTDTDDDSEWASEDSGDDRHKPKQSKAKAVEEARLREAAEEAQRQRDMFAKVPKRSYSNLNRVQSGLLSQLLNPDPNIFPPNHPYRTSRSTQDMTQFARQGPPPAPPLQMRKSTAAVPLAAQVQVTASVAPADNSRQGVYRPKGRPQEEELEDTSDDENPDDTIQVSHSLAQQKLAALADPNRRRHSDRGLPTPQQQQQLQQMQQIQEHGRAQLPTVATAPIPLNHPYNLPAPPPPMTPRTTRRQMLQTELSESLRRNLLWERQVSRVNMTRQRGGVLGSGLRPLTSMNDMPVQQAQGSDQQQQQQPQQRQPDDKEEKRRRAMARNRSWADDYHYSGW